MHPISLFFSFDGRIGRLSFWSGILLLTVLISSFLGLLMSFVSQATAHQALGAVTLGTLVFVATLGFIPLTVMYFAVIAKRYHDLDRSLLRYLVIIIPLVGPVWALIELGFTKGTPGTNCYGLPPGTVACEEPFDAEAAIRRWQERQLNEPLRMAYPMVAQQLTSANSAEPQLARCRAS